jgi:hypothetical protein
LTTEIDLFASSFFKISRANQHTLAWLHLKSKKSTLRRVGCWSTNIPASKQARFSFLGAESDFRSDEMYIFFSFVCVAIAFCFDDE